MKLIEKSAIIILGSLFSLIFIGAIVYCANQMKGLESITEILFWSSLVLIFMSKIQRFFRDAFALGRKHDGWYKLCYGGE